MNQGLEDAGAPPATLSPLPGVAEVGVTFRSLVHLSVGDLRFAPLGGLPAATLRHGNGALGGESPIQLEIRVDRPLKAWATFELLAEIRVR